MNYLEIMNELCKDNEKGPLMITSRVNICFNINPGGYILYILFIQNFFQSPIFLYRLKQRKEFRIQQRPCT